MHICKQEAKAKAAASKQAAQADQLQQDGDKAIAAGERGRSQQGQEGVTPLTKRRALGDNTTTVTVVGGVHLGNSWWFRDKTGVEKVGCRCWLLCGICLVQVVVGPAALLALECPCAANLRILGTCAATYTYDMLTGR